MTIDRSFTKPVSRRGLLCAALATPLLNAQSAASERSVQILESIWQGVRDQFYDPRMRGVDWAAVKDEFLPRARACNSDAQLLPLLREMLSRLRNSHIFLHSKEEWAWRRNILPFHFNRVSGRVFVRYVLRNSDTGALPPLEVGDEIVTVDGVQSEKLQPLTLARLDPIKGNPNFGPSSSTAIIAIRRSGRDSVVKASRVIRPAGFQNAVIEHPRNKIIHLRLFTLGSSELPPERLRQIWEEVIPARGLILDLRNCVGGDSKVTNFIAGSLLGANKPLFRAVPRPGTSDKESIDQTDSEAPRFTGRAVVLMNSNTESQPEILAAICKEYGCARLFGERSAGAFNGFTVSIDVPYNFALCAVPYTRSISPRGIEYEGHGVEPDEPTLETIADCENKRDRPLDAALDYLRS